MAGSADKQGRKAPRSGPVRTPATIKRLNMYRTKAKRAPDGTVLQEAFHNHSAPLDGRVAPSRNWFGSTRVVGQAELARMREVVTSEARGPNTFLVRGKRLPDALLRADPSPAVRVQEIEPFGQVFGPRSQRKRSRLPALDPAEVSRAAQEEVSAYAPGRDLDTAEQRDLRLTAYRSEYDPKLVRGQTARIYGEIYKVIDSSDVVVYVLDARDPAGTRSPHFERYMRLPENEHKHVVLLLNKCDLVPTWATSAWIGVLSRDYPTLAFRASLENPFGKGELLSVLRQFSQLHQDKPQISVGLCGYPNVGKSSIINTLTGRPGCRTAPVPGETKVWQYVALTRRIFLVDAPGVVWADAPHLEAPRVGGEEGYHYENDDVNLVLRGVLRPEYIDHPEKFVPAILGRVRPEHLNRTYGLRPALSPEDAWAGPGELLEAVARRQGRLLRGGEPDARSAARMLIEDFVRGRLPHFLAPHSAADAEAHRAGLAEERRRWGGRSDAELISFKNTQDLRSLDTRAPDPEAAFRDAFMPAPPDPEPRPDEGPRRARLTSIAEQFEADGASDSGEEGLESSEEAPARPRGPTRASEIDLGPGFVVPKERRKPSRAAAGHGHRERDLTRALRSGVVDQADVDRVCPPVSKRAHSRDRGGAARGKTGEQFYPEARAKKGIIGRTVKKRLA